ncbi:putative extracellular dihydrogeodin oxidase/laccase [Exidia glandulosa HHB12029]|uniref:laccase n=1 Tax=Exidia glandulosa HHB12029 TaxID=1314781 RepID=A0A165Q3M4_EXIGL|nr:putative extracellular dihydrogeodin oxidase/laccase [Exidia glandulosa HHB12029]
MRFSSLAVLAASAVPALSSLLPPLVRPRHSQHRALAERATCTFATSKLCWDGTYDINTDYYSDGPTTGKTVTYYLSITNTTLAPDGFSRQVLTVNNTIPGPTITADWGDTLVIHVTNALRDNGTSIHWHGIRQLQNSINDGVNGVTECPIAPGDTKTYTFKATQYGTSWGHSHYSAQYGDGVWFPIVINGPATAEYDVDLGPITINDWFHQTAYAAAFAAERTGPPRPANFLIAGTNALVSDTTQGKRFTRTIESGKKYRLRLINTSVDSFFKVSIDSHVMTVIASDFVPVKPFTTEVLGLAIGQRYDVIIEANQAAASYWFRVWPQISCSSNDNAGDVTGYLAYSGVTALPTSEAFDYDDGCDDQTGLVPYVPVTVDSSGFSSDETDISVSSPTPVVVQGDNVFRWLVNGAAMDVDWGYPTLQQLSDNNASYAKTQNVLFFDEALETAYWVIQNAGPIAHPIHLHGHDFNIVSSGTGTFSASTATLDWDNPPRRDVAMLPASGYLFIAFQTDNPGAWVMHCHIAWHVSEGLSLQLVERQSEIFDSISLDNAWESTCTNWNSWYNSGNLFWGKKTDSGL